MSGNSDNLGQYLQGVTFPANKEEVTSNAESNGVPQEVVDRIKNATNDTFDSADGVT